VRGSFVLEGEVGAPPTENFLKNKKLWARPSQDPLKISVYFFFFQYIILIMNTVNNFSVTQHLIESDNKTNELLILEPSLRIFDEDILFFHGHQIGVKAGAWETPRYLLPLLSEGYRIIAPSILGYGKTTGTPDYCGPETLQRLEETVKNFITKPVHVMGASRGGTLAVLYAEYFPENTLCCTAIAGAYDLKSLAQKTKDEKLKQNIRLEAGGMEEAFTVRDPKTLISKLTAPLHIIHGQKDEQIPVEQASDFAEFLTKIGINHKLTILEEEGHKVFSEKIFKERIIPFLKSAQK